MEPFTMSRSTRAPIHKRFFFLARLDPEGAVEKFKSTKEAFARRMAEAGFEGFDVKKLSVPELKKAYDDFTSTEFKPDRRRLSSVEDFFRYTEDEGALTRRHSATTTPLPFPPVLWFRSRSELTTATFVIRQAFLQRDGHGRRREAQARRPQGATTERSENASGRRFHEHYWVFQPRFFF